MDGRTVTAWVVVACWLLWAAYWFLASRRVKEIQEEQSRPSRVAYLVLLAAGFILIANRRNFYPLGLVLVPRSLALRVLGDLLCIAGTIFAIWSRHVLAGNWSAMVSLKKDHELVERGPYALLRHP